MSVSRTILSSRTEGRNRALAQGHRRLAHYFCRYGTNSNVGQRLLRVKQVCRRRRSLPRQLRRWPDGSAATESDRLLHGQEKNRLLSSESLRRPAFIPFRWNRMAWSTGSLTSRASGNLINGGFFVFRREMFNYINEGEDLVEEPFPPSDRGKTTCHLSLRWLLGLHGYVQGEATPRRPARQRQRSLASLGCAVILPCLALTFPSQRRKSFVSGRMPMTSRSAAAGLC